MSTTTYGPPIVLAGPLPQPLPFGLFSAATIVPGSERWGMGARIRPYPDKQHLEIFDPCFTGTFRVKSDGVDEDFDNAFPLFSPYTVVLTDLCDARGVGTDEGLNNRVQAAFAAVEQWAVEHELMFGDGVPTNLYLSNGDYEDIVSGSTPVTPMEGLALLEKRLGDTGKAGMIHADRATVSAWSSLGALRVVGQHLETFNGTPVASGGGYAGAIPEGGAALDPEQGWAWVTGPVEIRRGEIEIVPGSLREALDRSHNLVTYRAERDYLVDWDAQLQAALLVDRSL